MLPNLILFLLHLATSLLAPETVADKQNLDGAVFMGVDYSVVGAKSWEVFFDLAATAENRVHHSFL